MNKNYNGSENADSLNKAFQNSYKVLSSAASEIVGRDLANDVVHDVYLKMLLKSPEFRGESDITTYLYRAVRNAAVEFHRRRKVLEISLDQHEIETYKVDELEPVLEKKISTDNLSSVEIKLLEIMKSGKKWYIKAAEVFGISPGAARVRASRLISKIKMESV